MEPEREPQPAAASLANSEAATAYRAAYLRGQADQMERMARATVKGSEVEVARQLGRLDGSADVLRNRMEQLRDDGDQGQRPGGK